MRYNGVHVTSANLTKIPILRVWKELASRAGHAIITKKEYTVKP